jgi:hypothetical protein
MHDRVLLLLQRFDGVRDRTQRTSESASAYWFSYAAQVKFCHGDVGAGQGWATRVWEGSLVLGHRRRP